jgi:hypothetical protein
MDVARWLRSRSEHYLLITAQEQIARRYAATAPTPPRGLGELLWRRVFAPAYRAMPWPVRHRILQAMPGSHRQHWAPPPHAQGPAV